MLLTVSSTHLDLVAMGPSVRSIAISEITAVTRVPIDEVPKAERSKHLSDSAIRIDVSHAPPVFIYRTHPLSDSEFAELLGHELHDSTGRPSD